MSALEAPVLDEPQGTEPEVGCGGSRKGGRVIRRETTRVDPSPGLRLTRRK
jgi:hypothetical protein